MGRTMLGDFDVDSRNLIIADTIDPRESENEIILRREIVEAPEWNSLREPFQLRVSWGARPLNAEIIKEFGQGTLFISAEKEYVIQFREPEEYQHELSENRDGSYGGRTFIEGRRISDKKGNGIYHVLLPRLFLLKSLAIGDNTRLVSVLKTKDMRLALTYLFEGELEVTWRIRRRSKKAFSALRIEDYRVPFEEGRLLKDVLSDILKLPVDPEIWKRVLELAGK